MKKLYFSILLLVALLFTSCSALNFSDKKDIKKEITNEKFVLVAPYRINRIFISFADERVNGNSGVNMFMGNYKVNGDKISMGPLASTMMAGQIEDMVRETYILSVLNNSKTVSFENNILTFTTDDNQFLKFKKVKK